MLDRGYRTGSFSRTGFGLVGILLKNFFSATNFRAKKNNFYNSDDGNTLLYANRIVQSMGNTMLPSKDIYNYGVIYIRWPRWNTGAAKLNRIGGSPEAMIYRVS